MTDSANPKRRNLWKILFGVSLALNLLIVGALGGAFMRKGKGPTANHLASGFLYMRALEFKDKRALRKEILRNKDGRKLVKDRNQASFNSAVGILKSHPFDRAAFENLLDEQAKHAKLRQDSARIALVNRIENMTKEERRVYAQRLKGFIDDKVK
tara:strand:- start:226 stop:690 length:465 start_codon:yes stop_codon:yes gene_type:complete